MIRVTSRFAIAIALIAFSSTAAMAQRRRATPPTTQTVLERNVRAEVGFLASDAMQGRGSATNYERVAAEYIGSMFRQFGLEPGGDTDATGARDYVQKVALETGRVTELPVLKVGSGSSERKWQFGRDFLLQGLRTTKIAGGIQIIEGDTTPAKGSIAVIRIPSGTSQQIRQEMIRKAWSAQAAAAVVLETEANKATRESGKARLPNLPGRITGQSQADGPFAIIQLSKEAFDEMVSMSNGTPVELTVQIQVSDSGATWNAVGILSGSDPQLKSEAIILSAHLDHLGVGEPIGGDAIFNGADDDASGCVAVLELARVLATGRRPRRTIYFVCFGSEERGGLGSRFFVDSSPVPLDRIVANIQFEMLGRRDSKVAPNTLWLTGYERSNLGPQLARQGARLVADPHPEQNFFQRSDNYTLALRGVVAHTVSSFGLHTDYHRPTDDLSKIDFPYMTSSINSMVSPVRWLANSTFRPEWLPGQQPRRN